jgi:hypothetical protein
MTTKQLKTIITDELEDKDFFDLALYVMGYDLIEEMTTSIFEYIDNLAPADLEDIKERVNTYLNESN